MDDLIKKAVGSVIEKSLIEHKSMLLDTIVMREEVEANIKTLQGRYNKLNITKKRLMEKITELEGGSKKPTEPVKFLKLGSGQSYILK